MGPEVVIYVDKTVVKIKGIKVIGLKPYDLEKKLEEAIGKRVRIIGVTGDSIDMDVYGLEEKSVYKNESGIIKAISMTEGIMATEVIQISSAEKIMEIDYENIPKGNYSGCAKERWQNLGK